MICFYLVSYLFLIWLYADFDEVDIERVKNHKIIIFIQRYSFYGLIEPIRKCGSEYSLKQYLFHCLVFGGGVASLFYLTTSSLLPSLVLLVLTAIVIPYVYFLNIRGAYLEYIEENIFIYSMNIIIYLKENNVVSDVLLKTSDSLSMPMKKDIVDLTKYINDTNNFNEALDNIENKYRYSVLRNVHILLKNARERGFVNYRLYDYTFSTVEQYQLQLNNYRNKKKASRNLFYFMEVLDFAGVLFLIKMFSNSSFIRMNEESVTIPVFVFYLLNIITVIFYERYCMKINSVEKGINL